MIIPAVIRYICIEKIGEEKQDTDSIGNILTLRSQQSKGNFSEECASLKTDTLMRDGVLVKAYIRNDLKRRKI